MDRTNIYLEHSQTEALDRLATDEGVSRAEIIRRLLDEALGGVGGSVDRDLGGIDSSFGALRDASPPERAPGGREDHLRRVWQEA